MIKFRCPSCQTKLGVPDEYANRRVRCNKCGQPCVVPKPIAEAAVKPSAPQPAKASVPIAASPKVLKPQPAKIPPQPLDQLDFIDDSQTEVQEDRNAAILKQVRRDKMAKEKIKISPAKSAKGPSVKANRPAGSGFSFSLIELIPDALHFPLSIILALLAMSAVIGIWIVASRSAENSLGFFALFVPWAAAAGIRLLSVNRTFALGTLAAVLGIAGISLGRVVIAKQVVIPWMHKTANQEILVDLKTIMADPKAQFPQKGSAKYIANDGDFMTCVALIAAVEQDSADPVIARKLALGILRTSNKTNFLEMISQAGTGPASLEASAKDETQLSEQESEVMDKAYGHLGAWEEVADRLAAARKYYPALSHLNQQCEMLRILEDPERTFRFAVVSTLDLFDVAWLLLGLCGTYAIASFDFG